MNAIQAHWKGLCLLNSAIVHLATKGCLVRIVTMVTRETTMGCIWGFVSLASVMDVRMSVIQKLAFAR